MADDYYRNKVELSKLYGQEAWDQASYNEDKRQIGEFEKDSGVKKLIKANLVDRYEEGYYTKFSRKGILDPYNSFAGAREYLFFTRPSLYIFQSNSSMLVSSLANNDYFSDLLSRTPEVLGFLQSTSRVNTKGGTITSDMKFNPLLTNAVSSTLELPDKDSTDVETGGNIYGTRIYYRGNSMKSDENFEFSLEFEDGKYSEVYNYFKAFDEYKQLDWLGKLHPEEDDGGSDWINKYIINKIITDQISIYKIVVDETGYGILYFAKVTGCYPKGLPRSVWNDVQDLAGYMKITTQWKGQFIRDTPIILSEFNKLSTGSLTIPTSRMSGDVPLYDIDVNGTSGEWVATPYIMQNSSNKRRYQLRWKN